MGANSHLLAKFEEVPLFPHERSRTAHASHLARRDRGQAKVYVDSHEDDPPRFSRDDPGARGAVGYITSRVIVVN